MKEFIIYSNSDTELLIYDYTTNNDKLTIEPNINDWRLIITSNKLNNVVELNIIDYIYNKRKLNELYIITPDVLGLTDTFKDGLYKFDMYINNNLYKTHYIILYNNIYNKFLEILEHFNYTFTVSSVGYINYIEDCNYSGSSCKTEEIRLLSGLINQLQQYKFNKYSATVLAEVDDIINKAYRIAEIIE